MFPTPAVSSGGMFFFDFISQRNQMKSMFFPRRILQTIHTLPLGRLERSSGWVPLRKSTEHFVKASGFACEQGALLADIHVGMIDMSDLL